MGFDGNPSKSHLNPCKHWVLSGRSVGARTPDPLIKSQLLYQLSYTSIKPTRKPVSGQKNGASEGSRTLDNHLGKVTLYQLSYARVEKRASIYHVPLRIQHLFEIKLGLSSWGSLWNVV
jgi:hypothetical protein